MKKSGTTKSLPFIPRSALQTDGLIGESLNLKVSEEPDFPKETRSTSLI